MLSPRGLKTVLHRYDPGYTSHYAFSEDDAREIMARGSSRGFKAYSVWANCLVIDLDSGDPKHLETVLARLQGVRLDVWESGSKGWHVVVYHRWMQSPHLPYSHLRWVESLGVDVPFDRTLYQHGRIVSLPGRIHPKTRRRKRLLFRQPGGLVTVPIHEPPAPKFDFSVAPQVDALEGALTRIASLAMAAPPIGGRHTAIWGTACDLFRAGLSFETARELLLAVNRQWTSPKADEDVTAAVTQAWSRHSG